MELGWFGGEGKEVAGFLFIVLADVTWARSIDDCACEPGGARRSGAVGREGSLYWTQLTRLVPSQGSQRLSCQAQKEKLIVMSTRAQPSWRSS